MTKPQASGAPIRFAVSFPQFRIWHLWLLSVLVGVAIVNIQDQRRSEPLLIGLAIAGFVLYTFLGWGAWVFVRRYRSSLGTIPILAIYLIAMASLFLAASIIYVFIEYVYLIGF